jgi:hydroxymethylglutaryl-CoA reductase (NADPH)
MSSQKLHNFDSAKSRRDYLQPKLDQDLSALAHDFGQAKADVHCENLVGGVTLPLGIAGPLTIKGEQASGEYFVPLATTEGALVASISRGCKAVSQSGGVVVQAENVGITRGPVFLVGSIDKGQKLQKWIEANFNQLKEIAESTSSHLKYLGAVAKPVGQYAFVRFQFDPDQAMGMNMATIASQKLADFIEQNTDTKCLAVAGNYDIDKKPAWLNLIQGRGRQVWAEVILNHPTLQTTLKTTAQDLFEVWLSKCMLGSAMSGSLGFNAHYANVVAAFFAATGQDLAQVVEGSLGITTAKILSDGSLYFSVYLPSIMLATVGGGTKLPAQQAAQSVTTATSSQMLAEVLGGAVLAGELSLLASLAQGTLAKSHQKLGR